MRHLYTKIFFLISVIITIFSCTKELDIDLPPNEFDFTVSSAINEVHVGQSTTLNFNISGTTPNAHYQIRYAFNNNYAELMKFGSENDTILTSGIVYNVDSNNFSYKFTGVTDGRTTITFYVKDTATGIEVSHTVTVVVTNTDYFFMATGELVDAYVNEAVKITMNITETIGDGDTFKAYFTTSGNGYFTYNNIDYAAGELFDITGLESFGRYFGIDEGEHDIEIVMFSDSVNKQVSQEVEIEFLPIDFSLAISDSNTSTDPRPDGYLVGDKIELNHMLTELGGSSSYTVQFTMSGSVNTLTDSEGNLLNTGTVYPITYSDFDWYLEGDNVGTTTINYIITDSVGNTSELSQDITFINETFDFTVSQVQTDYFIDELSQFKVSLVDAPTTLSYTLQIESTNRSDLDIIYQISGISTTYAENESINLLQKTGINNTFNILHSESGISNLVFKIIASNGEVITKNIDVNYKNKVVLNSVISDSYAGGRGLLFKSGNSLTFNFTQGYYAIRGTIINNLSSGKTFYIPIFSTSNTYKLVKECTREDNGLSSESICFSKGELYFLPGHIINVTLVDELGKKSNTIRLTVPR